MSYILFVTFQVYEKDQVIDTKIILSDALVLNSVTTKGLINSKDISSLALLNSSPNFHSSLTFGNLEVSSVYSNDRISSINFTKWYDNVLWKNGKDIQRISGNWKLKTAIMANDVTGNGLINGQSVNEIEKNLNKNVNEIEMALSNYTVEYRSMCEKLQYRADSYAKSSIYVLKYFEEAFRIIEDASIFSYYLFDTRDERQYLFVNTNCSTTAYKWNRENEKFLKLGIFETGVVYNWHKMEPENSGREIFIITNSKMVANAPCMYGGTNTWKFVDEKLLHVASISYEADIVDLFVHPQNTKSFFAIYNTETVENMDILGRKLETWNLAYDNYTYSFVPAEVLPGLNINNGRRIFSLDTKFLRGRKLRSVDAIAPIIHAARDQNQKEEPNTFTVKYPKIPDSIPTIPSKPVKKTHNVDFLSKVRDAGDVIRKTFEMEKAYLNADTQHVDKYNKRNKDILFFIKAPNVTSLENIAKNLKKPSAAVDQGSKMEKAKKEDTDITKIANNAESTTHVTKIEVNNEKESTQVHEIVTEPSTVSSENLFTPRVIMGEDDNVGNGAIDDDGAVPKYFAIDNALVRGEPVVDSVTVLSGRGVSIADNNIIPEHGKGEIIAFFVGTEKNKKQLYAISRRKTAVIQGNTVIEVSSRNRP